jgi:hypothetical protein
MSNTQSLFMGSLLPLFRRTDSTTTAVISASPEITGIFPLLPSLVHFSLVVQTPSPRTRLEMQTGPASMLGVPPKTGISTRSRQHLSSSAARRPDAPSCHQQQARRRGSSDGFGECLSESSCSNPSSPPIGGLAVWTSCERRRSGLLLGTSSIGVRPIWW